jgi:hypothetical protein
VAGKHRTSRAALCVCVNLSCARSYVNFTGWASFRMVADRAAADVCTIRASRMPTSSYFTYTRMHPPLRTIAAALYSMHHPVVRITAAAAAAAAAAHVVAARHCCAMHTQGAYTRCIHKVHTQGACSAARTSTACRSTLLLLLLLPTAVRLLSSPLLTHEWVRCSTEATARALPLLNAE